jgi:hypothetical protein
MERSSFDLKDLSLFASQYDTKFLSNMLLKTPKYKRFGLLAKDIALLIVCSKKNSPHAAIVIKIVFSSS